MYDLNGKHPSPLPTQTRATLSEPASAGLTNLRNLRQYERLGFVLMLCALLALLVGCATPSTLPSEGPANPKPPQLRQPLPQDSYLLKAQQLIESWQKRVTGM